MWIYVLDYVILNKISELNRSQLEKGERGDGSSLPDYSQTSVEVYGKEAGVIKLFETGYFYNTIEAIDMGNVIAILSNPLKRNEITGEITNLKERYGYEIIGISDENMEVLRKDIRAKIVEYIFSELRK